MYPGWHVLINIAGRTAIVYGVVLLGMRLSGKREVGQMTPFDLTLLLLLSNAVQNAMTGPGHVGCRRRRGCFYPLADELSGSRALGLEP